MIDVSAAVKHSGSYDPWVAEEVEDIADGLEHTKKPKIKASFLSPTIRDLLIDIHSARSFLIPTIS